ncbi:MAG: Mor transcription activator family protein [Rhodoferax sp.]
MNDMFQRLELQELTAQQLTPLEALMAADWPDVWRELATSHYVTLLSAPGAQEVAAPVLAKLAVALTLGLAQDLGGTQPYIAVGAMLTTNARARRVVDMLGAGTSYRDVAKATGLTEPRVRQIEAEWRRQQIALRQGRLPFDDT